eukprot:TRINITY_DN3310_c0_g1_i7.p1 TRINITY_DN3310_c0_g1~~TRINITY_DN3310_c0_g1_i7.p1  ORF type:complete len:605 (-),score=57.46 TRINITY_DN3310_c0_g1_i7:157-1716(-)
MQKDVLPIVFRQALQNLGRFELSELEERAYVQLDRNWYHSIHSLMNLSNEEAILIDIPLRLAKELRTIAGQMYIQSIENQWQPNEFEQEQQSLISSENIDIQDGYGQTERGGTIEEESGSIAQDESVVENFAANNVQIDQQVEQMQQLLQQVEEEQLQVGPTIQSDVEQEERSLKQTEDKAVQVDQPSPSKLSRTSSILTSQQMLEAFAKDLEGQCDPIPDDFEQLPVTYKHKQPKNVLAKFSNKQLPENLQKNIAIWLDNVGETRPPMRTQRQDHAARCLHYLHIVEQLPWDEISLEKLVDINTCSTLIPKVLNWIQQQQVMSSRAIQLFLRSIISLAQYLKVDNCAKVVSEIEELGDQLKLSDTGTSATWEQLLQVIKDQRDRIRGLNRTPRTLAWDVQQSLLFLFCSCFNTMALINFKLSDVTIENGKYVVNIQGEKTVIPEFFTQQMQIYIDKYRKELVSEGAGDCFFSKQDGSKLTPQYCSRIIFEISWVVVRFKWSKKAVVRAIEEHILGEGQ